MGMRQHHQIWAVVIAIGLMVLCGTALAAPGNGITYQGTLADSKGNAPADGIYPMAFSIWDALADGSRLWQETGHTVTVTKGAFAVELGLATSFGRIFEGGTPCWLEVSADLGSGLEAFKPRVHFTMVPLANWAIKAEDAEDANLLDGLDSLAFALTGHVHDWGVITGKPTTFAPSAHAHSGANITSGKVGLAYLPTGAGSGLDADFLDGNHAAAFSLTSHVHSGAQITSGKVANAYLNTGAGNGLDADTLDTLHAASFWKTLGNAGTVSGTNFLGTTDNVAFDLRVNNLRALRVEPGASSPNLIGGYIGNYVTSGAYGAVIGGGGFSGYENVVTDDGGFVGGGAKNYAGDGAGTQQDKRFAMVGGGYNNTASGECATVGGGYSNTASSLYPTVGGGYSNTASGTEATVGGGYSNTASGSWATVPGGDTNTASGGRSFAAGYGAKALHSGSFVWVDSTGTATDSTAANQFRVRATGGVWFYTNTGTAGLTLAAGGGSWTSISDRNAKENFATVDAGEVLDKVAALPVTTWNYKAQDAAIRHIGPMAQDVYAAFGVGETDTGITTVDADGVALAAIQGLNQRLVQSVEAKDQDIAALRAEKDQEIAALRAELQELKALVNTMAAK